MSRFAHIRVRYTFNASSIYITITVYTSTKRWRRVWLRGYTFCMFIYTVIVRHTNSTEISICGNRLLQLKIMMNRFSGIGSCCFILYVEMITEVKYYVQILFYFWWPLIAICLKLLQWYESSLSYYATF